MPVHLLILWPHIHKNVHLASYPRLLNQQLASVAFRLRTLLLSHPCGASDSPHTVVKGGIAATNLRVAFLDRN